MVLLEAFPGHGLPGAGFCDHECENGERQEEQNEHEHDEQVQPRETRHSAPRTQHAGQRHHKDENPDDYDRPFQETHAHCIVLLC